MHAIKITTEVCNVTPASATCNRDERGSHVKNVAGCLSSPGNSRRKQTPATAADRLAGHTLSVVADCVNAWEMGRALEELVCVSCGCGCFSVQRAVQVMELVPSKGGPLM